MSDAYLTSRMDQIGAAVARGDADTVEKVIDSIDGDGHPKTAAVIAAGLARTSIGNQINDDSDPRPE